MLAHALGATLTGVIRDRDRGFPLFEVIVTSVEQDRRARTDSSGVYRLVDLDAGPQHITVHRVGYAPYSFHALLPRDGVLEIDVALRPEPITLEEVEVSAPVQLPGLESPNNPDYPDRGMSMAAVRHHPLLAEPDALQATAGGEVTLDPESPSGVHVRGAAGDQVAYLLDGIPVLSPYHAAGTFGAFNPDALSRIDLFTALPPAPYPDALAGTVSATTLAVGNDFRTRGSLSSSQARLTFDGPVGDARFLLGGRSSFPGLLVRGGESSYLNGEGFDWIGKVETPLFSGSARLLGAHSDTEVHALARADIDSISTYDTRRNEFSWNSSSLGGSWSRAFERGTLHLDVWSVAGDAEATWSVGDTLPSDLTSRRHDLGSAVRWKSGSLARSTTFGVRAHHTSTRYQVRARSTRASLLKYETDDVVSAAFLEHSRPLASGLHAEAALVGTLLGSKAYSSPSAQLRWSPRSGVSLTASYAGRHQVAQSLRSSESVIGNVFPADLYVGSAEDGVPVARGHQGVIAVEIRPTPGVRVGAQVYTRSFDRLALVAPEDTGPFATSGFVRGSGAVNGAVLEAGATSARLGAILSYGYQDGALEFENTNYVPKYSAGHSIDLGLTVFPSVTSSVRIGLVSVLGRRGTASIGGFEWEACNLLDPGCELAGNPSTSGDVGAERLPGYFRIDLGARKHWHFQSLGREWTIELFGSATNLLGRKNILTIAVDPTTGRRSEIEMRPLSPLVVGLDWRF